MLCLPVRRLAGWPVIFVLPTSQPTNPSPSKSPPDMGGRPSSALAPHVASARSACPPQWG